MEFLRHSNPVESNCSSLCCKASREQDPCAFLTPSSDPTHPCRPHVIGLFFIKESPRYVAWHFTFINLIKTDFSNQGAHDPRPSCKSTREHKLDPQASRNRHLHNRIPSVNSRPWFLATFPCSVQKPHRFLPCLPRLFALLLGKHVGYQRDQLHLAHHI